MKQSTTNAFPAASDEQQANRTDAKQRDRRRFGYRYGGDGDVIEQGQKYATVGCRVDRRQPDDYRPIGGIGTSSERGRVILRSEIGRLGRH